MKIKITLSALLIYNFFVFAQQNITWTEISSDYNIPSGVKVFKGERISPALKIWYIEADLKNPSIGIKAYQTPAGKEGLSAFSQRFNTIASINGGYFDVNSNTSYSACIQPGVVQTKNIAAVTRNGLTYYVTRTLFGINDLREMSVDWIYHFGNNVSDIYTFSNPTQNQQGTPAPAPSSTNGQPYYELLTGIGGGPMLVKNGQPRITYTEEVFWGSGVSLSENDPRTAIGFTQDKKVIMLVADGRYTASVGISLTELAQIMISLGCVEATNLDGGGSSQIAVRNQLLNLPTGGTFQRPIPTMIAVVAADSIPFLPPSSYIRKIDTEDSNVSFTGSWFTSSMGGYYGGTPSKYANAGNGDSQAEFLLQLPLPLPGTENRYRIDAWWTAASNRAVNTPFIIQHVDGIDTIFMNQSINGSKWNYIGTFSFNGDSLDRVIISNNVEAVKVVIADAIRIIKHDTNYVSNKDELKILPEKFILYQNYPNPFNPSTTIKFSVPSGLETYHASTGSANIGITLRVYDILGKEISTLINQVMQPGIYEINFDGSSLPSGIYFYQLFIEDLLTSSRQGYVETRKMILMK